MNRKEFSTHISEQVNRNLEDLFNQILEMGGLVERQLVDVKHALETNSSESARAAIELDKVINREESIVDYKCATVLARTQPQASDLRLIIIAIRVAIDLERMGDETVKIAQMALSSCDSMQECEALPGYASLIKIMDCSCSMLQTTLNAFSVLNINNIAKVFEDETRMDQELASATLILKEAMSQPNANIDLLLDMYKALRAAERITDHAQNIAESVIYLVKGEDVRNIDSEALAELLASKES